jgi:hypothetical protein
MSEDEHTFKIEEGDRQCLLLALAKLSLTRPGWHPACTSRIADILHGREMYESFRGHGHDPHPSMLFGAEGKRVAGGITIFPNLNVAAHDAGGRLIPELSDSLPRILAEHLLRCGYDPEGVIIESFGINWKLIRTAEGWMREPS